MNASSQPTVSAIVAVYNGELHIESCPNSILNQTYKKLEIIVVDDGSTDNTVEVISRLGSDRIRLIRQDNLRVAKARQAGCSMATGEFLAFCDHDDLWEADKIETQLNAMMVSGVVLAYTDAREVYAEQHKNAVYSELHPGILSTDAKELLRAIVREQQIPLFSTFMARKKYLVENKIDFSDYPGGVDDVGILIAILLSGGKVQYVDRVLTYRNMHGGNWSAEYLRRFQLRIPLYQQLLSRYGKCMNATCRRELRYGLSDALYRVASEIVTDRGQRKTARKMFFQSFCNKPYGIGGQFLSTR